MSARHFVAQSHTGQRQQHTTQLGHSGRRGQPGQAGRLARGETHTCTTLDGHTHRTTAHHSTHTPRHATPHHTTVHRQQLPTSSSSTLQRAPHKHTTRSTQHATNTHTTPLHAGVTHNRHSPHSLDSHSPHTSRLHPSRSSLPLASLCAVMHLDDVSRVDCGVVSLVGSVSLPSPPSLTYTVSSFSSASSASLLSSPSTGGPLPLFHPGLSATSSASSPSPASTSPPTPVPLSSSLSSSTSVRVRHDKQRRNASEVRRRGEMRNAFRALQSASRCPHAGRYSVLTHATALIKQLSARERGREGRDKQQSDGKQPVSGQLERVSVSVLPPSLLLAATSSSSLSESTSTSSSSHPSSPVQSASHLSRSSPQLCALSVCQWLPVASCVCDLTGALLAVNTPLAQLLDCPSVAFCLQHAQSLYSLVDRTSAQCIQRAIIGEQGRYTAASQRQLPRHSTTESLNHSTAVKRVKSENGSSHASGLKYEAVEAEDGSVRRRQPRLDTSHLVDPNTGIGSDRSNISGLTANVASSLRPVSSPLPARSLVAPPPPTSSIHQRPAAPRLTHSAVGFLSAVSGASRLVQLSVSTAGVRDINEWRPAIMCVFTSLSAAATTDTTAAMDGMSGEEEEAGEPLVDWANARGGLDPVNGAAAGQPLQPPPASHHPPQSRLSLFSHPPDALSWHSCADMQHPSLLPPSLPLPLSATSAPSNPVSTLSPRSALAIDYYSSVAYQSALPLSHSLHTPDAPSLHSRSSYSKADHPLATVAASHLSSLPLSSSPPSAVSSSSLPYSVFDSAATAAPASASVFPLFQSQLSVGSALSLSPNSLARRLLCSVYR